MNDKEILQKWNQGLSKDKLAKVYQREYNKQIKIIRSSLRHRFDGKFISNFEALAYVEKIIYKHLTKKAKILVKK